ncbi:MAG: adenylate/guanylate cyclase domain-containing protein [Alphaproteobacteria bacterium]|nr:MAG: adenylate/guanylate cyclase domain-containing protein [Alphaproteobacteria bacterium]
MHILLRGGIAQRLRIATGLILFTFATTHFLNHAVGLVDLGTMHEVQAWRQVVTRSLPGTIVLALALVTHIGLGLFKLARRTTLRLPPWELFQLGLGLLIPFLLLPHIVNTRIAHVYFGVEDNYLYELARLWPASAILQSTLLLIVWLHGCIGIHYWLRLYPPYRAALPVLLFIAIAVPLAALGGFMVSGQKVASSIENAEMFASVKKLTHWPNAADGASLELYRWIVRFGFAGLLAFIALCIGARQFLLSTRPKMAITYTGGPTVRVPFGPTLLEISRMNKIPHASVCGGRARCSTCRVRIDEGAGSLSPPGYPEAITLASIAAPPNVRLACQVRPASAMTITRLLRPASTGPEGAELQELDSAGVEKSLAVMFLDLRDFTQLSQSRLPYDVVFILNEFFAAAGAAIHTHGGWIDKFLGDGLLAIFGQRHGVEAGCRQVLRAARAIDLALDHVNAKLGLEIGKPLRVGIGIHAGPMLIGRIGYGEAVDLTVVGNAVNVASRLEAVAKQKGFQIVMSSDVATYAGCLDDAGPVLIVNVRGVDAPMEVVGIMRGRDLPASILAAAEAEGPKTTARRLKGQEMATNP